MYPIARPGRLLKRELEVRNLSANRLALALGVPSGRITDILNGRRSITAETAVRLGRYFAPPESTGKIERHPSRQQTEAHQRTAQARQEITYHPMSKEARRIVKSVTFITSTNSRNSLSRILETN